MSNVTGSWPMANYMSAWKTFRRFGNEPAATADHIISLPGWPAKETLRVLDIGCGDGRMLEAFLQKTPQKVTEVTLLEPDERLLPEASSEIQSLGLAARGESPAAVARRCIPPGYVVHRSNTAGILPLFALPDGRITGLGATLDFYHGLLGAKICTEVGVADKEALELAQSADVGLAIHLVYLLAHNRFRALVDHWPEDAPLFVVLDAPESIFTELWTQTAPDYAIRSARVHDYLSGEANGGLEVRRSDFSTRVTNPFDLPESVQGLVLSLLCYCDYDELPQSKRLNVERVIQSHLDQSHVACSCTCYEIHRRAGRRVA